MPHIFAANYQHLIVEKRGADGNVGFIQLNRPKALNALCDALMLEMQAVLNDFEKDNDVGCVVLTGSEKAFAGEICILFVGISIIQVHSPSRFQLYSLHMSASIGLYLACL